VATSEERPSLADLEGDYTRAAIINAEGARVGIMTCRICGAAVVVDPRDEFDATLRHSAWHVGAVPRAAPEGNG
jgi:hypothetical protein